MQTALIIVVFLANASLVGAGIYLSAYLKKKAEGLATKEEFKELKEQTAELTRTTKQIEAEINSDLWSRQKRWELKRDLILEMTQKISVAYDVLSLVYATYQSAQMAAKPKNDQQELTDAENRLKASSKWGDASTSFDGTLASVALICEPELTRALRDLGILTRKIAMNIQKDPAEYLKSMPEYIEKTNSIEAMMRKELGIQLVA